MAWLASPAAMRDAAAQAAGERPVRLIVGVPAGSSADLTARVLADAMEEPLGQRVIVENRPGADGIIAFRQAAGATPDGATLLLGLASQFAINPAIYASLPYDPLRDLVPISPIGITRTVLAVHPSLPVANPRELVAWTREHPGTVSYSAGSSTFMLSAEAFNQRTGADMLSVPFNGGAAAIQALVAGTVQASFATSVDVRSHARSGRVRVLAVSGGTRLAELPDVPTFAEAGFEDPLPAWLALFAPAATPPSVVDKVRAAALRAIASPKVHAHFAVTGQDLVSGTAEELTALIVRDTERARAIARKAGVVPR